MSRKFAKQGFGIVEVLIASMILVTVVGAVVALGSASVRGGLIASDKTTAYNLMQECFEQARGLRDATYQAATATVWNDDLTTAKLALKCTTPVTIGSPPVEYTRSVIVGDVPWYSRTVPFANGDPREIIRKVDVTITWTGESGQKSLSASEYLTNWRQIN